MLGHLYDTVSSTLKYTVFSFSSPSQLYIFLYNRIFHFDATTINLSLTLSNYCIECMFIYINNIHD